ncbi:hypothetical protein PAXRUDRAFT_160926 [Paxillus rubicundulus Ve08.2h10]|uniref:Uncharacterized protein n=1 Tax=Paxillus rubicundulus Ve08.2h10 TaxID=930991 RepID=A0A0D0DMD6_9AGAM|nr:hypothetical protein PAXRUDRAFT_160926 [Paxillus rubicundulus Ve08.2h10]
MNKLHAELDANNEDFNPNIKLPARFIGSHAWTSEKTADAMVLGQRFGKSTFWHSDLQSRLA